MKSPFRGGHGVEVAQEIVALLARVQFPLVTPKWVFCYLSLVNPNCMKKILIVSLSAGAGHVRAATALRHTAQKYFSEFTVEYIDMADYISTPLRKTITDTYDFLVKKMPGVWGYIYQRANSKKNLHRLYTLTDPIRNLSVKKFFQYIEESKPDLIITTHSFPAQVIRRSHESYSGIPLGVVITDYALHKFWLIDRVDWYFASCARVKNELLLQGVQSEHVFQTGIPVDPVFFENKNVLELKRKYQISPEDKVLLLLSGGQGMVRLDKIVIDLQKKWQQKTRLTVITIAGSNEKLQKSLDKLKKHNKNLQVDIRVVGWTESIDEYMRVADLVVTKSGGLTTTECLTLKKFMVITRPVPGQEEENAQFILEQKMGVRFDHLKDLIPMIQTALSTSVSVSPLLQDHNEGGAMKILSVIKNVLD